MKKSKVSIIIPVYNVEAYLPACLDAILAQTFGEWEAVCVNDGSTDTSEKILKKYAQKDPRIKVISQQNQGVSAARNTALNAANGNYICFIDADDEVAPTFLEKLYQALQKTGADIAWCDYIKSFKKPTWKNENLSTRVYDHIFDNFIGNRLDMGACIWTHMYRKKIVQGLSFPTETGSGEDLVFLYSALYKASTGVHVPQTLYLYRTREGSAMHGQFSEKVVWGNIKTAELMYYNFKDKKLSEVTRKILNQKIAKRIFKYAVLEPKRKDKKNLNKWYRQTRPLLAALKEKGVYRPCYLSLKNRLKSWLFLTKEKRQKILPRFVKLLTIFIPFKSARHRVYDFLTKGGWRCCFSTPEIRLNYYTQDFNFGDVLNEDLMRFFNCPYGATYARYAELTCIGSLLQEYLLRRGKNETSKPMHIFGSGFIKAPQTDNERFCRPMIFHALRGKLSLARCEKITGQKLKNLPLGDPGLLIKYMFPNIKANPVYDVGIICHYLDKEAPALKNIRIKNLKVHYINVAQNPSAFIEDVSKCGFILSSAMHGLICADSLGIPNKHIILSDKVTGGEYKFRDYYSVFKKASYQPVYLTKNTIKDADIKKFKADYSVSSKEIDAICRGLIKAFSDVKKSLLLGKK